MSEIVLPVSIGEALDKLSILDIKRQKINDTRKQCVEYEYTILNNKMDNILKSTSELYFLLKTINLVIWDQMDNLRDNKMLNENDYTMLCKQCIETNDMRFRVKNKINLLSNSTIKEQKSYNINTLKININSDNLNLQLLISPLKYLSLLYDQLVINSTQNMSELLDIFKYDSTIIWNNFDIQSIKTINIDNNILPHTIYTILDIDENDFKKYF